MNPTDAIYLGMAQTHNCLLYNAGTKESEILMYMKY